MEELISVIVPVYNVEIFFDKCMTSIVNQTYKNLEIILVDDGSTDKSGKKCDEWKEKDERIKVIHKENGGASSARNVGLEDVTGNWISFIDSDDYIEKTFLENLYNSAKENNADIAAGGFKRITLYKEKIKYSEENFISDKKDMMRRFLLNDGLSFALCDKIYKKKLFDTIRFPEGKMDEDIGTLYRVFDNADKLVHINKSEYYYIQRNGSVEHSGFSIKNLAGVEFTEAIVKLMEKKYPDLVELAENLYIYALNNCTILCYRGGLKKEHKELKEKLKKYIPKILKNSKIKLGRKIKSILIVYFGGSIIFKR